MRSILLAFAAFLSLGSAMQLRQSELRVAQDGASAAAIASREALAAISRPAAGDARRLVETGREGLFVFRNSDLSAQVAADPRRGFYVAPASDMSGRSGAWVRDFDGAANPEWFGFSAGAGQAENTAALRAAIDAALALGVDTLRIPAKTFALGHVVVDGDGLILDMTGAVLRGTGVRLETREGSSHISFLGGHIVEEAGSGNYLFNFRGSDISVDGTVFEKLVADDSYHGYVRGGTERVRMNDFKLILADDGIFVEGKDHAFTNFHIAGERGGNADDSFAVNAINGRVTENIDIGPGTITDMYTIVGLGSFVGTIDANDPTYSSRVRGVRVHDVVADRVTNALFIKPGGVAAYDNRNGVVEDILFENINVRDPTGAKFRKGIAIHPGRNSIVRRVTARNIVIEARALDGKASNKNAAIDIWGQAVRGHAGAGPAISDIDLEVAFEDPLDGAPHSASAPGYPLHFIAHVDSDAGSMERITLRVDGNGAQEAGIHVGAGIDGAVTIERAHLTNVAKNPGFGASARGGITALSDIALGTDLKIEPPSSPTRGFAVGGVHPLHGRISYSGPGVRQALVPVAAGSSQPLFVMPADGYMVSAEIVDSSGAVIDRARIRVGKAIISGRSDGNLQDASALFAAKGTAVGLAENALKGAASTGARLRIRYMLFGG